MLKDYREEKYSSHASNLGAILAHRIAEQWGVPAFIVDPVTTDDFIEESRISGVPGIERKSRSHALNIRYCVQKAACELGMSLEKTKFVTAHLGSGFSIAAVSSGKIIDVNDALLGMGPFSVNRAGALPIAGILNLVFRKGMDEKSLIRLFTRESGLKGYLGTSDLRVAEKLSESQPRARLILTAMIHQIKKEIGAMFAVLDGDSCGLILTGGLVRSHRFVTQLKTGSSYFQKIFVYPGSFELEALAKGALGVLRKESQAMEYKT